MVGEGATKWVERTPAASLGRAVSADEIAAGLISFRHYAAAPLSQSMRWCCFAGPPSGCLMVYDPAVNIISGKAAGVRTCGFTRGLRSR